MSDIGLKSALFWLQHAERPNVNDERLLRRRRLEERSLCSSSPNARHMHDKSTSVPHEARPGEQREGYTRGRAPRHGRLKQL
jgi:hypothetical protein